LYEKQFVNMDFSSAYQVSGQNTNSKGARGSHLVLYISNLIIGVPPTQFLHSTKNPHNVYFFAQVLLVSISRFAH